MTPTTRKNIEFLVSKGLKLGRKPAGIREDFRDSQLLDPYNATYEKWLKKQGWLPNEVALSDLDQAVNVTYRNHKQAVWYGSNQLLPDPSEKLELGKTSAQQLIHHYLHTSGA
jgi:hypothetical protein